MDDKNVDDRQSKKRKVEDLATTSCCSGEYDDSIAIKPDPLLNTNSPSATTGDRRTQYATKEDIENFRADLENLRADFANDIKKLNDRLNRLVSTLAPATLHAKFETSVYSFVDPKISSDLRVHEDKIKHGVTAACMAVLVALTTDNKSPTFLWHGPSTRQSKHKSKQAIFSKEDIPPLVEAGLKGTEYFIVNSNENEINALNSSQRNKLVHNGEFLDSMFGSPQAHDMEGTEFEDSKNDIRNYQTTLQRAVSLEQVSSSSSSSSSSSCCTTRDFAKTIKSLRKALESNNFAIADETEIAVVNGLIRIATWSSTVSARNTTSCGTSTVATCK